MVIVCTLIYAKQRTTISIAIPVTRFSLLQDFLCFKIYMVICYREQDGDIGQDLSMLENCVFSDCVWLNHIRSLRACIIFISLLRTLLSCIIWFHLLCLCFWVIFNFGAYLEFMSIPYIESDFTFRYKECIFFFLYFILVRDPMLLEKSNVI